MNDRKASSKTSAAVMLAAVLLSTHAAAQPAPKPPPVPAATDFLQAVNETPGTVRLELFSVGDPAAKGARANRMACLKPKESARWTLGPAAPGEKIRLQTMRSDGCEESQQVACERSIDRAPGLQYVTLRGDGRNCGVFPMPGPTPGLLKQGDNQRCGTNLDDHWGPLKIVNDTPNYGVWVTIYENVHREGGPPILAAACWMPGETRTACVDRRKLIVRGEVVGNERWGIAKSCSERVYRDTKYSWSYGSLVDMTKNNEYSLTMTCPGHECRWDK